MINLDTIRAGILGVCVGDALGVSVEFRSRASLKAHPVTTMVGHGMHNQPPGTWSDDSSLTLCLLDSLCHGYDERDMARRFEQWLGEGLWTARGAVFDVGNTTREAIFAFSRVADPTLAGPAHDRSNGNGARMRILPMAFAFAEAPMERRINVVRRVSRITHGHARSQIGCAIYVEVAVALCAGMTPAAAVDAACRAVAAYSQRADDAWRAELPHYHRIIAGKLAVLGEADLGSGGYVVHTLEAALWCLLTTDTYETAVLKAVNLGDDADTTGAVTGGLAGIRYGAAAIPAAWLGQLARGEDIEALCRRFSEQRETQVTP